MECDICHKDFKNIEAHRRLAHPTNGRKNEGEIAEIIYRDVVKVLSDEYGLKIEAWEDVDKEPYLVVARTILSKEG